MEDSEEERMPQTKKDDTEERLEDQGQEEVTEEKDALVVGCSWWTLISLPCVRGWRS